MISKTITACGGLKDTYQVPLAENLPYGPEGTLCASASGSLDDFSVIDYPW